MTLQLSQNIKLIRSTLGEKGATQNAFAALIREDVNIIKAYETGRAQKPKTYILKKIAAIAGVSVDELLNKDLSETDMLKEKIQKPQAGPEPPPDPNQIILNLSIMGREQASANNTTAKNFRTLLDATFKNQVTQKVTQRRKKS